MIWNIALAALCSCLLALYLARCIRAVNQEEKSPHDETPLAPDLPSPQA